MPDNAVTLTGNVTRDPDLRFLTSGQAVASFGIAVNTRKKDGDQWVEGDPQFYDISAFGTLAENVAESVAKGTRVVISGRMNYRQWEADDGSKRSKVEVVADEVGPSLRWATATVERNEKTSSAPSRPARQAPKQDQGYGFDEEPF